MIKALGAGRWGDVWLVEHRPTAQRLALKRLHTRLDGLDLRYLDELEAWTSLGTVRHIVPCYFWRTTRDGVPLIFTRYLRGGSLSSQIARGMFEAFDQVLQAAIDLADALTVIHERSVYHGDVSPNNILLGRERRLLLADFGQSRLGDSLSPLRGGTPAYFPHGQAAVCESPAAVDLWSYGLVLLHLLAGTCFWHLGGLAPLVVERAQPYLLLRKRTSDAWRSLLAIAARCFVNNPGKAREVGNALRGLARAQGLEMMMPPAAPPAAIHQMFTRRVGDIDYDDPAEWVAKARERFGAEAVSQIGSASPARFRRAALVAAERTLTQLLPLFEVRNDLAARRDYISLLVQVMFVRQAADNHADARLTLETMAIAARRWESQDSEMLRYRALALQELANIRSLSGESQTATLRLYDLAARLLRNWKAQRDGHDPQARLPHALMLKADVLRFWQRFDDSRQQCKEALRLLKGLGTEATPDQLEVLAYAYKGFARTLPSRHPGRAGLYRCARAIYQGLIDRGHNHYIERAAMTDFELLRGRLRDPDVDQQLHSLRVLQRHFQTLVTRDQRTERIVHLARTHMLQARLLLRREQDDQAYHAAHRAVRLMDRGIVFGQIDLWHECAAMHDWLAHLYHVDKRTEIALKHARRAQRLWKHLVQACGYRQYARLLSGIEQFCGLLERSKELPPPANAALRPTEERSVDG